jgi:F-type H+-transporting ATPase subunit delta
MTAAADQAARKCVRALLEVAQERGETAAIGGTLRLLQERIAQVPEWLGTVSHPGLSGPQQRELLEVALGEEPSPLIAGFLDLLIAQDQMSVLSHAADLYDELNDELQGVQRVSVETAVPLSTQHRDRLATALAEIAARPVRLEERVSPEVLGGLRIRIGHTVIDASIQGRLRAMREAIEQAPVKIPPQDAADSTSIN